MNDPHVWKLALVLLAVAATMLFSGCAPGDHNLPDSYYGPYDYYAYEVQHVPQIGK